MPCTCLGYAGVDLKTLERCGHAARDSNVLQEIEFLEKKPVFLEKNPVLL
jgi:hypothetical protein